MTPAPSGVTRRRLLQGAAGGALALGLPEALWPRSAEAAVDCAGGNPVVVENRCTDPSTWSGAFQLTAYDWQLGGFPTQTTFDVGDTVPLKLFTNQSSAISASVRTYRLGWYGGNFGRLVDTRTVSVAHRDASAYDQFGTRDGTAWPVTVTLPAAVTAVSGVYLVKLSGTPSGGGTWQNHIVFIVRDDARPRDVLVALPTNTWQAYNAWGGKSLYYFNSDTTALSGFPSRTGDGAVRAAKVSYDRPHDNVFNSYNWVLRTELPLIAWLERQGFDVAYTDDLGLHGQPAQLLPDRTKVLAIPGHSEYWSKEMVDNVQAARDAGTHIASFSANTAYWKVRVEDSGRTLVCFKTVEGSGPGGSSSAGVNDYGPDNTAPGQANSARGTDNAVGGTGSAADHPEYATTTWRDPGAASGASGAPPGGRVGLNRPESSLFGVLYIGDDDDASYGLRVPYGLAGTGEFSDHRAWRHTSVSGDTLIGSDLVGWEWDGIPRAGSPVYAAAAAALPAGIRRVTETDIAASTPNTTPDARQYLQDAGRAYGSTPPAGQPSTVQAITYTAPSGALVFSAGTMQWSWGLAPHYMHGLNDNYQMAVHDSSDARIQQATANILADMGVKPTTPEGIVLDPPPAQPSSPASSPGASPPNAVTDTAGPKMRLWRASKRITHDGHARLVIASARDERDTVTGYVALRTAEAVKVGRKRRRLEAGRATFHVRAGAQTAVKVRLASRVQALLRRHDTLRLVATVVARDPAGHRTTATVPVVLHAAPKAKRRA